MCHKLTMKNIIQKLSVRIGFMPDLPGGCVLVRVYKALQ